MLCVAIRDDPYNGFEVYGPFAKRPIAAKFIERSKIANDFCEWWEDDWYIGVYEPTSDPEAWQSIDPSTAVKYRAEYCEKRRKGEPCADFVPSTLTRRD